MNKIENIDKIMNLIKKEVEKYDIPSISDPRWKDIEHTPFTTLVSCILSLRTKDEITEKASQRLLHKYNTPKKLANASEEEIKNLIYPVGFYRNKTKTLKQISHEIIHKNKGKVPDDFNELLKLKGVGRKTASIVMVYGHGIDEFIPVDIHVHVIANRLGWIKSKDPDETMDKLMKIVPKKYWHDLNHLFVKFGQKICLTISPFCSYCPIEKYCKNVGVKKHR